MHRDNRAIHTIFSSNTFSRSMLPLLYKESRLKHGRSRSAVRLMDIRQKWALAATSAVLFATAIGVGAWAMFREYSNDSIVDLGYSRYEGEELDSGVSRYLGMRYAAPPVGDLRFRAPVKPKHTTKVQNAKKVSRSTMSLPHLETDMYISLGPFPSPLMAYLPQILTPRIVFSLMSGSLLQQLPTQSCLYGYISKAVATKATSTPTMTARQL